MSFRFALAPVLRLRQSVQRQRTLQLQEANLRLSRAEASLGQMERFLAESAQSESARLVAGCSAAELQFAAVLREKLEHFRQELQSESHRLEAVRQKALGEYHRAYREREVLETMRARQRREYQKEQLGRQQKELDADYLLQHWHERS